MHFGERVVKETDEVAVLTEQKQAETPSAQIEQVTKKNNLLAKSIERNREGDTIETTWTGEAF